MAMRLFKPAAQVAKKVKLVVYGEPGTGKTLVALSFPRVAFIDMEGSADLYAPGHQIAGWGTVQHYDVLRTKTLNDILRAVDEIRADAGRTWDTLVIDPATVLNQVLQDAGQVRAETRAARYGKSADEASMTDADWGTVKRKTYSLMTDLVNLPVHVVLTAHLREVFETRRVNGKEERIKIGVRPDAEKKTTYWADFVFELQTQDGGYFAVCKKERGGYFKLEQRIAALHYSHFLPFVQGHATGEAVTQVVEAAAARLAAPLLEDAPPPAAPPALDPNLPQDWTGMLWWVNEGLDLSVQYENEWHLRQAVASDINAEHDGDANWKPIDAKKLPYPTKPDAVYKVKARAINHALAKQPAPASPADAVPDYEGGGQQTEAAF